MEVGKYERGKTRSPKMLRSYLLTRFHAAEEAMEMRFAANVQDKER